MFTLLKTHSGQRKGGRVLFRKRFWLRILVLGGLGTMVLAVCSLLLGCGSDSTPGGAVKGKDAKAVTSPKPQKTQGPISLMVGEEQTAPGEMGKIKHQPESTVVEPFPGLTEEEMDARTVADRKILESPDTEVFPGMTQGEQEARLAADPVFDPKTAEVFPGSGMTQTQLEAKLAADTSSAPKTAEVFPGSGITQTQLEAQNTKQEVLDAREIVPPAVGK